MRVIIALALGSLGVAFVYSGVNGSALKLFGGFFGSAAKTTPATPTGAAAADGPFNALLGPAVAMPAVGGTPIQGANSVGGLIVGGL